MKLLKDISIKIKKLRKSLNMTQEELADKVGVRRNFIGLIEREASNCSVELLEKIAVALNTSISELLGDRTTAEINAFYAKAKETTTLINEMKDVVLDLSKSVSSLEKDLNKILKNKP